MLRILSRLMLTSLALLLVVNGVTEQNQVYAQCNSCGSCGSACSGDGSLFDELRCAACRRTAHFFGDCQGSRCRSGGRGDGRNGDGATCQPHQYGRPDLFYNYYVTPQCGTQSTQLYVSPHPVPAHVGQVHYTYQPFMPHEFLYPHSRTYHRYYDEGQGLTRTHVRWYAPPLKTMADHFMQFIKIPR
ncbi:MAG: hypothetical protein ACI9G1_002524 [Pirellulaceae bacterium]|jgi:hypothetical protein